MNTRSFFEASSSAKAKMMIIVIASAWGLSACQGFKTQIPLGERPPASPVVGGMDWGWDVAGDAAVRPIQVFSNAEKTWLQMAPHHAMPAVFVNGEPVPFSLEPPYIVLAGNPSRIELMSTNYKSLILKRPDQAVVNKPALEKPPKQTHDLSRIETVKSINK